MEAAGDSGCCSKQQLCELIDSSFTRFPLPSARCAPSARWRDKRRAAEKKRAERTRRDFRTEQDRRERNGTEQMGYLDRPQSTKRASEFDRSFAVSPKQNQVDGRDIKSLTMAPTLLNPPESRGNCQERDSHSMCSTHQYHRRFSLFL